jgi:hypothetical protein
VRVTYTLHLLPVHGPSGETPYLVTEGDTSIVSAQVVYVGDDPAVRVLTCTAHYDDEATS